MKLRWAVWVLLLPTALNAQTIARIHPLGGGIRISAGGNTPFVPVRQDVRISAATIVRTEAAGRADIFFDDGDRITMQPRTIVRIAESRTTRASLSLGQIRVRLQRLLSNEDAREFRTPVAVAAVRGTDFVLVADEGSRTRVYVSVGALSVANAQRPQDSVRVVAGQMTEVLPFLPPTPPRAFGRDEYQGGALLGALEAGEDPALEASQEVAHVSYLAFRDAVIDAPLNPAYLAEAERDRLTFFALAAARAGEDRWAGDSLHVASHVGGSATAMRVVGLLSSPARANALGGVAAYSSDAALERTATDDVQRHVFTTRDGQLFGTHRFGLAAVGLGGEAYESRVHAWSRSLGHVHSTNTMYSVRTGYLGGVRAGRSLGLKAEWSALDSRVNAPTVLQRMHGGNAVVESLLRWEGETWRHAGLLRIERTATRETFVEQGAPTMVERRTVWSIKAGPGFGRMLGDHVMFSSDVFGGWSYETAQRHDLQGALLEDEIDTRWSATVHLGSQLQFARSWFATIDVLEGGERQAKDFAFPTGNVRQVQSVVRSYSTRALVGVAYARSNLLAHYLLVADGGPTRLQHALAVLMHLGGRR